MDIASNRVEKLIEFPTNKFFTSFDYSKATGKLLLSCIESKVDSLWQMPLDTPSQLVRITSDVHTHDHLWDDARWINDGQGYAFIRHPGVRGFGMVIKTEPNAEQTDIFKENYIQYFLNVPDHRHLLVVGDLNNLPGSAIWEYDIATKSNRCIVAGSDQPLKYLKHVPMRYSFIRMTRRQGATVVVFPPVNFDRESSRQYPVVITSIRYVTEDPYLYQYPEAIANAGADCVVIDHGWSFRSLGSWAYLIRLLRDYMVQLPHVDTKRVFAMSNSAQAWGLVNIFTNQPGLWRGAILLAPPIPKLPTPKETLASRNHFKLLITTESGLGDVSALQKYQEYCAADGMAVDWIIHPHTPHEFVAHRSQQDRIAAMLHFVFDDHD